MMKRRCSGLIAVLILLALLSPAPRAQTSGEVLEDTLTGNLSSQEDTRWYSFELSEAGDVTLTVRGLQEDWDGYNAHWTVTVYAPDRETVLARDNARGYNGEYSPPTVFSLLELESGTYYIQVAHASSRHFTTEPFRLELERTYRSQQPYVRSNAGEYIMGEEPFQDRLTTPDQVRLYRLVMEEPGDAIVYINGLQEERNGYTYHWCCTIYQEDGETAIATEKVRGNYDSEATILSAPDLESGTYWLEMTGTKINAFTTAPYEIRLTRAYHSRTPAYDGGGVQTFQSAGDLLWAWEGTSFLKLNDGECFCALMHTRKDRAIVPILVSTDPAAVEYLISSTGEQITAGGPWHDKNSGLDYYYSKSEYIESYAEQYPKKDDLPILYTDTNGLQTSVELMMKKLAEAEKDGGGVLEWIQDNLGMIVGAVIVLGILIAIGNASGESSSYSGSYSDSSYSGSVTVSDFDRYHDELDAVQRAQRLNELSGQDPD